MNTNIRCKGRAVVLALVLILIVSVPVLANAGLTAIQGREYDSRDIYEQYQWVMGGMKPPTKVKPDPGLIPPDSSADVFEQYLWALEQMEAGEDADWTPPDRPGVIIKPDLRLIPPGSSADAFEQYLWAIRMAEKASLEALLNK